MIILLFEGYSHRVVMEWNGGDVDRIRMLLMNG